MSLDQLRNCNFGRQRADVTGSTGVGYTLFDALGGVVTPRTTSGVYQLSPGSGLYAAYISFPDAFRGQLMWDCPSITGSLGRILSQSFATEQFNVEENNPKVNDIDARTIQMSGTIGQIYDVQYGRWKIVANQMIFYKDDNVTEITRFNLFDDTGAPSMDAVFERYKV